MAFAKAKVLGRLINTCAWSSIPPIATAFILFARAIPPKYGQSRSWSGFVIDRRRSFVLKTQCIKQLVNECIQPHRAESRVEQEDFSVVPDGTRETTYGLGS